MSDRSEYVKVYDRKSKQERTVTRAAYKILAGKRYDFLADDVEVPQKKSDAEPVADNTITGDGGITQTEGIKVIRKRGRKPEEHAQE